MSVSLILPRHKKKWLKLENCSRTFSETFPGYEFKNINRIKSYRGYETHWIRTLGKPAVITVR